MKIIFLDIDGVLNSSRSVLARVGTGCFNAAHAELVNRVADGDPTDLPWNVQDAIKTIDLVAVGLVNRLARDAGAKIVLSSSHRAMFVTTDDVPFGSKEHRELLNLYLSAMGLEHPVYDITEQLYTLRGYEIDDWLKRHRQHVTHYVILDDGKDFLEGQNLVWCDSHLGFSHISFFEASKLLGLENTSLIF